MMRRLNILALLTVLAGCRQSPGRHDTGDGGSLSDHIELSDPSTQSQRLSGFYAVQESSWAWSAPSFSVVLAPAHSILRVRLYLPAPEIEQLKEVTLRARANGVDLPPESYREAGQHVYARRLPPGALAGPVRIDFTVDNPYLPKAPDERKLGVVLNSIALEAK